MFYQYVCSWESNPQPFALLTQCSTTEPQEHYLKAEECIYAPVEAAASSSAEMWLFPRCYLSQSPQEAAVVRLRDVDDPRRRGAALRSAVIHTHRPPRRSAPVCLRSGPGLAHLRFVAHHCRASDLWHMIIKQQRTQRCVSDMFLFGFRCVCLIFKSNVLVLWRV